MAIPPNVMMNYWMYPSTVIMKIEQEEKFTGLCFLEPPPQLVPIAMALSDIGW